jgi:hypothetical protein
MKYLSEILWLLSWPALIYASYKLSELALKKFKKVEENSNE